MSWGLFENSLVVACGATSLALALGSIAALCLGGLERRWRGALLAVAIISLALPPFLVTNAWLHFLGEAGVWRSWLPVKLNSLPGTIWVLALLTWPVTILSVSAAWRQLEAGQLESDMALTGWGLIRGLLFPLGRAALAQAAVLTFVLALNNFAVPAILQTKVFPAEVWIKFNTSFDTAGALGLSWPLVLAPLLLLVWFFRREVLWPRLGNPVPPKLFRKQLGGVWFWFAATCTLGISFLSVVLPLLQLVSVQRTWTELSGALAAGRTAIWNSIFFAAASATLVVVFALAGTARRISPRTDSGRRTLGALVLGSLLWLPFLVPGVLLGIGFIFLFNRPWSSAFYQSAGIVIIAFVVRYLGLGWNVTGHALRTADRDLTDAALIDGARRWHLIRHVHWPQIGPQVAAIWYVVYVLCLWDVESMVLIVPPDGQTLALRIFNLLHYGYNAQVNALCLTLLVAAVAPLLVWKGYSAIQGLRQTGFSDNAANLRAFKLAVGALMIVLLPGCSPRSASNDAALQSRLFSQVEVIGTRGVGVGQLNKPRSVAVDNQDNVYVVDMTGRVQKFSSRGTFLLSWQMPQTDLGRPKGMCRDREGNIVVIEPHYQRLNHFAPDGKLVSQWGQRGTNTGQLSMPRAAAINSQDEIFVSEYGVVERVQRFSLKPTVHLIGTFGQPGTAPGDMNRPEGLCVDAQDRVYIADSCNHRIQIFSREGKFIRAYGKAGSGPGELSYPYDICVDASGRQYVCEFGNSRIQVFDPNDQPLEIIGGPGAEPGRFNNPWGVALDSAGNLYVADSQNHRVQKLIRREPLADGRWSQAKGDPHGLASAKGFGINARN